MSKGLKSLVGSISPLYGALTGQGMLGGLLNPAKAAALREEAEEKGLTGGAAPTRKMAKGGTVKRRGDGIAKKGKTKGRMK